MSDWDDDALMRELAAAVGEREAVPASVRQAARAAFAWRTVDEDLMRLSYDSLASREEAVVRADTALRVVAFTGPQGSLELELDERPGGATLIGQVVPGRSCRVVVNSAEGRNHTVETDHDGFFSVPILPAGPVRFLVISADHSQATQWLPR